MSEDIEKKIPEEDVNTDDMIIIKEHPLEAGEKVFAIILLVTGIIALALSLELWGRMKEPKIASAAAVPLFVSGLWTLMALLTVIENFKLTTPLSGMPKGLCEEYPLDCYSDGLHSTGLPPAVQRGISVIGGVKGYVGSFILYGSSFP